MVEFVADRWRSGPVHRASGFRQRLSGIIRVAPGVGVLLRTRSVHTMGLRRPLLIVGLDEALRVVRTAVVPPRRLVWWPGARYYLELAASCRPPPDGAVLHQAPIVAP